MYTRAIPAVLIVLLFASPVSTHVDAQSPATSKFLAAPDQQFTVDGVTLRYREVGAGAPVVLIHGYAASLERLAGVANALSATHRVVALDLRGFGRSSKFADASRFGQAMVDDVVRLMDHLKITRAHLVGHSMGALIAANLAVRYPTRVSGVALLAGPFYPDKPSATRESQQWVADLEGGRGLVNFMQWLFPKMTPEMAAGANAQSMKANDLPSLIAVMRSLPQLSIPNLRVPGLSVLVAAGSGDPLHPLSVAFARSSPGARLVEVQGADHINIIAAPEVQKAVHEWLQQPPSSSGQWRDAA